MSNAEAWVMAQLRALEARFETLIGKLGESHLLEDAKEYFAKAVAAVKAHLKKQRPP